MNNVSLTGRITKDPEIKFTESGNSYVLFTIAVDRKFKDRNGERQTDFIPCVAWNNQASFIYDYVKKGNMIEITGAIQTRSYQTQSGENKFVVEVVLDSVSNLTPKPKEETTPKQKFEPSFDDEFTKNQFDNDDLPF